MGQILARGSAEKPLELPVKTGGLGKAKLVGNGLNPQAFAIAVRKGSTLLPEINRAIFEMVNDGTTAHLIETYLQFRLR